MIYIIKKMFNANGTFIDSCPELIGVLPIFKEINFKIGTNSSLNINKLKKFL